MPLSSASAGEPVAFAAAWALIRALPTKLDSVSSGSGRFKLPAPTTLTSNGASKAAISSSLPWLWVANIKRSS